MLAEVTFTVAKRKEFLTSNRFKLTSVIRKRSVNLKKAGMESRNIVPKKAGREEQIKLSILVLIIVS